MNWKDKIGTAQFWTILVGVVTAMLVVFNVSDIGIDKVVSLVLAIGTMVCFIATGTYVELKTQKLENYKKAQKKEDRE